MQSWYNFHFMRCKSTFLLVPASLICRSVEHQTKEINSLSLLYQLMKDSSRQSYTPTNHNISQPQHNMMWGTMDTLGPCTYVSTLRNQLEPKSNFDPIQ